LADENFEIYLFSMSPGCSFDMNPVAVAGTTTTTAFYISARLGAYPVARKTTLYLEFTLPLRNFQEKHFKN
jgi:hypothetical protein